MPNLDVTHDPARKSWVAAANDPNCDFPIQNLPFGVFSLPGEAPRVGVAIGDQILDLSVLEEAGLVSPSPGHRVFSRSELNPFMALGTRVWRATRHSLSDLLAADNGRLRDDAALRSKALVAMASARLHLPIYVRSFTDFFASKEHATNTGSMFRDPANALLPNWLHVPIAYNGRASTVVVSGTDVIRPLGQMKPPDAAVPTFGPSRRLDIELELGAVVGTGNAMGQPVSVAEAYEMIFGYVLLNDWSARDIQAWEYQPLGPFLGKAFATSISPWIVTRDALEPYRVATPERLKQLLPYLAEPEPYNYDLQLEVDLLPAGAAVSTTICRTNARGLYYSTPQQLAHHASGGCRMCTGDLIGSGTISGTTKESLGSLLELTWNGKNPLALAGGATRQFLEDGDTVTLRGWSQGNGHRIGFGACSGTIRPSPARPG